MRTLPALCLILALPISAAAATIHVPADQPTIAAGLAAALPGDSVEVACGEYYEHDLVMPSGVTLGAPGSGVGCVTIFAQGQGRFLSGSGLAPGTRVENMFVVDAHSGAQPGGAMDFADSSVEIRDCWIWGGVSDTVGGGIALDNCDALLENVLFTICQAEGSGGALRADGGTLTLRDCAFEWNAALDGGGLALSNCDPLIEDCTFVFNDAQFWGGAVMLNGNASPTLRRCTLAANDAYEGGGLWGCYGSSALLEQCVVALGEGTGLHSYPDLNHPTTITVSCSNIYGYSSGNYGGDLDDQTGVNGNISGNPLFCDLYAYDLPNVGLAEDSPCLPENNDCGLLMGAHGLGCEAPTAVGDAPAPAAALLPNRPNPFNPATEIVFSLARPAAVTLTIHDLAGRRLITLLANVQRPAGEQSVRWDGRDATGRSLPSGVYVARLAFPEGMASRKLTLLK
ncbi:MAG: FlgD immunoglobulin-like domain containing protein [Candidatus Krumholzibacteriia bacterium]